MILWLLLYTAGSVLHSCNCQYDVDITEKPVVISFPARISENETACDPDNVVWSLNVRSTGLGLSIFINETFLDSDIDQFISISADERFNENNASIEYITGNHTDVKLAIPLTQRGYLQFHPGDPDNCSLDHEIFKITFQQYELAVPEPEPTPPNPYPPTDIRTSINIFLSGKTLTQFNDAAFQRKLQTFIFSEALEFARKYQLEGADSAKPVNETIFFSNIQSCPRKWESYDTCVELWLAVYLTKPDDYYEMTVSHLQKFWAELVAKGFDDNLGVKQFEFPDASTGILWWVLWLMIALVITLGLGALLHWIRRKNLEAAARRAEKDGYKDPNHDGVTFRKPVTRNMQPSKHQTVPSFAEPARIPAPSVPAATTTLTATATTTPATATATPTATTTVATVITSAQESKATTPAMKPLLKLSMKPSSPLPSPSPTRPDKLTFFNQAFTLDEEN